MCRLGWALLLALAIAGPADAAGEFHFISDFVSEYVFRGATFRQGASVQPSVSYDIVDTLTASVWTNLRLERSLGVTEVDYALQWRAATASRARFSLGSVFYDRSSQIGRETAELFAGVELAVPASPALYVYYDYRASPGFYYELTFSHRLLTPDQHGAVDLGAALGFDTGRADGFHDARLTASFSRWVGDWRLSPAIDLWFPADRTDASANGFRPVVRFTAAKTF